MRTRVKGNRSRRACIELLELDGWLVDIVEKTGRFIKVKDLFGIFDLIALKEDSVSLIQVTTNKPHTHKLFIEFKKKYPNICVFQFVWKDRKGFIKYSYLESGKYERKELWGV